MNRHAATRHTRFPLLRSLGAAAVAGLFLSTFGVPPAAAQVPKIQKLGKTYEFDDRLMAVASEAGQTKRCVAASVGHFAILTSYHCLSDWWTRKLGYKVHYASDEKRQHFWGSFERAHRFDETGSWALLQTHGHSSGYFGFEDLDRASDLDSKTFDLVGYSPKVKGGRELAVQLGCRLTRASAGVYTSVCGRDFDSSGILILRTNAENRQYVNGLAVVQSQAKVGKQVIVTLKVTSTGGYGSYGARLTELRQDQRNRYNATIERRNAAEAAYRASDAGQEAARAEAEERARLSAVRKEQLENFTNALAQLGATLGARQQQRVAPLTPTRYGSNVPGGASGVSCPFRLRGPAVYSDATAVAPSTGGTIRIQVDTPPGCWWRFEVGSQVGGPWINIGSPLSGTGRGELVFTTTAHPQDESVSRLIYMTVDLPTRPGAPDVTADREFRITQCASTVPSNWCGASASTSQ